MNKAILRNVLVLLLVSTVVFAVLSYISFLKKDIPSLKNQKQNLLQELVKEKNASRALKAENVAIKGYLKATHKRLNKSLRDLNTAEDKADLLNSQFSILRQENIALTEEKERLARENEEMKLKLSSLDNFKRAKKDRQGQAGDFNNHGFLINNGKSTASRAKVKIEVIPIQR